MSSHGLPRHCRAMTCSSPIGWIGRPDGPHWLTHPRTTAPCPLIPSASSAGDGGSSAPRGRRLQPPRPPPSPLRHTRVASSEEKRLKWHLGRILPADFQRLWFAARPPGGRSLFPGSLPVRLQVPHPQWCSPDQPKAPSSRLATSLATVSYSTLLLAQTCKVSLVATASIVPETPSTLSTTGFQNSADESWLPCDTSDGFFSGFCSAPTCHPDLSHCCYRYCRDREEAVGIQRQTDQVSLRRSVMAGKAAVTSWRMGLICHD